MESNVLKSKDRRESEVKQLTEFLDLPFLTHLQKSQIQKELKTLNSGEHGEKDSAYYLESHFKSTGNHVIIHDLRLELLDQAVQIDHLIINRWLDFLVLETKNFSHGIKINDIGEFMSWTGEGYRGIPSPIEQNRRHIELLQKIVAKHGIMPTRLGLTMTPSYKSYVLVAPQARIERPSATKFDTTSVVKADAFVSLWQKQVDKMSTVEMILSAAKMVSLETIRDVGKRLAKLHKPFKIDYAAKFGIKDKLQTVPKKPKAAVIPRENENVCAKCGEAVSEKVFAYCRDNKQRFNGKILCFKCQRSQ